MNWYRLTVSSAEKAEGKVLQCRDAFEKAFAAARGPRGMAVFYREGGEGGGDLFFTPDCGKYAADLLEEWGCTPCERPSLVGLQLLVGHHEITYYMPE